MSPHPTRRRRAAPSGPAPEEASAPPPAEPESVPRPFAGAGPEARRLAAAILEVLAGTQAPAEAARSLGLSLARYYQLELRAGAGLVAACEARRRGRGHPVGEDPASLRRECERLRRECARQQALVRAARRAVGLTPGAAAPAPPDPGRRRRRRPTARALRMAALLHPPEGDAPACRLEPAGGYNRACPLRVDVYSECRPKPTRSVLRLSKSAVVHLRCSGSLRKCPPGTSGPNGRT